MDCKLSKNCRKRYMIKLILSITLPLTCFYAWSNTSCKSIDDISWIAGDWQQVTAGKASSKVAHESWNQVSSNTLEGLGFMLDKNDDVVFQESLRIVEMQGQLFYLAKTDGNALPIAFEADSCDRNQVKFLNLSHDFPNIIHYTLSKEGLKVAVKDNEGKGFTLEFKRKGH